MRRIQDTNVGPGNTFVSRVSATNTPGTKIRRDHKNDLQEEICRAIESTGEVVDTTLYSAGDGNRDQLAQMAAHYGAGGASYFIEDATSAADAYVIKPANSGIRDRSAPQTLFENQEIDFIIGNTNTGASTLDVSLLLGEVLGTTIVNIKLKGGINNPEAGYLKAGNTIRFLLRFNPGLHVEIGGGYITEQELGKVFKNKSLAAVGLVELTSADVGRLVLLTSDDGGEFVVKYNATLGTYADDGGTFAGTEFIPSGGDGTIGLVRSYSGEINVKWFGLQEDASDETSIIQNAIDVCEIKGGGIVNARGVTFSATDVALKSFVKLDLTGSTVNKISGASDSVIFSATGTLENSESLTVDAASVENSATMAATTDFAVGDWVLLRDNNYISGTSGRNEEILRVESLTSTVVTFTTKLIGSYATADIAQLLVLNPIEQMRIIGSESIINIGTSVGGGVWCKYVVDSSIEGMTIRNPETIAGIRIDHSFNVSVFKNTVRDGQNQATVGYGIEVGDSSHFIRVYDNHTENVRENLFTNNVRHSSFISNTVRSTFDNLGFNTHGSGCSNIIISNNNLHYCGLGVGHGGQVGNDSYISIFGNTINNVKGNGIAISGHTTDAAKRNSDVKVFGNTINGFGAVTNNSKGISTYYCSKVEVFNNKIDGKGYAGADYAYYAQTADDCTVNHNELKDCATAGIYFNTTTNLVFKDNEFDGITTKGVNGGSNINAKVIVDKEQVGQTDVIFSASITASAVTIFPDAFEVAPLVTASAKDALGNFMILVSAPTLVDVSIKLKDVDGTARTGTGVYYWNAAPQSL